MLVETIAQPKTPIKMVFCQAPGAEEKGQEIYDRGLASWGVNVMEEAIPQIPVDSDDVQIDFETAKRHSFGFVEVWGRKAVNSNVVACLSTWLAGFDGSDPKKQAECGLDILRRIVPPDDATSQPYGEHKYVVFLETDLDAETIVRRDLDAQAELIGKHFPRFRDAQNRLTLIRQAQIIDLEGRKPFVDIFEGEVSALKRPWEDNDNEYYEWGYEDEEGDLFGINPDSKKQSLSSLIVGSPLEETRDMLTDISNFLKGEHGKNRFVIQLDFGEDASCSNTAINAQQNTPISVVDILNLVTGEFVFQNTSLIPYLPFDIYKPNNCQECKKNKNKNECNCEKKEKSA